jgi:hypothetical protein
MNWRENMQVESVWNWLKIATEDLCNHSKSRIALEIESHYNEAVSEYLAEGRPKRGAELLALEQLGNPKKARKSFRKKHLTDIEAQQISLLLKYDRRKWALLPHYLFYFLFFIIFEASALASNQSQTARASLLVICFIAFVVIPTGSYVRAKRSEAGSNISKFLLVDACVNAAYGCVLVILTGLAHSDLPVLNLATFLPLMLALRSYRLWRKVRKSDNPEYKGLGSP